MQYNILLEEADEKAQGMNYEYMIETYLNGNISQLLELYKKLCIEARKEFISYCFSEVNPQWLHYQRCNHVVRLYRLIGNY